MINLTANPIQNDVNEYLHSSLPVTLNLKEEAVLKNKEEEISEKVNHFKSAVAAFSQCSDGVSTADLLSMESETSYLNMMVHTYQSNSDALCKSCKEFLIASKEQQPQSFENEQVKENIRTLISQYHHSAYLLLKGMESHINSRACNFKSKVDALKCASDGVSKADMVSLQYEKDFLNMMVHTHQLINNTVFKV
ncbi:MAG: hypothetical protein K0S74_1764 [Chlamydiales bacterium]|jgi:sugar-specific transcriptional regulator TrmB|nr:hypothetical protein [Chlamydiales bacterium]